MFLSIIIPAYNAEKYIQRCIQSCLQQDIPTSEYELIVIDDGSTDNTAYILLQLSLQYSNITVYTQNNAGPSSARNLGISKAKGEYIWFVDADDTIIPDCLKEIQQVIKTKKLDSLALYWDRYSEDNNVLPNIPQFTPKIFTKTCTGIEFINHYAGYGLLTVAFIHKRNNIIKNEILFSPKIKICEDAIFNIEILIHTQSISLFNKAIYHYYQYNTSLSNQLTLQRLQHNYQAIIYFINLYKKNDQIRTYVLKFLTNMVISLFFNCYRIQEHTIPLQIISCLEKNGIQKLHTTFKKYYIITFLYNLSPNLCLSAINYIAMIRSKRLTLIKK